MVVDNAFSVQKSYFRWNPEAKSKIERDGTPPTKWLSLASGVLKFNTDGSLGVLKFNTDGSLMEVTKDEVVAGVCRDSSGVVANGFVKSIRASSAIEVETLALQ
ncbi:hypothetical protein NL676_031428 [Syzygium grande]|nr:hypothetical protein NL676_031428 [Syzygium grande]